MERKIHFRENRLIFGGFGGEAELILGISGAILNAFRELRSFFRGLGRSMHYFKAGREHRRMMQKKYTESDSFTKPQVHQLGYRFQQTWSVKDCKHNNTGNFQKRDLTSLKLKKGRQITDFV